MVLDLALRQDLTNNIVAAAMIFAPAARRDHEYAATLFGKWTGRLAVNSVLCSPPPHWCTPAVTCGSLCMHAYTKASLPANIAITPFRLLLIQQTLVRPCLKQNLHVDALSHIRLAVVGGNRGVAR